MNGFFIFMFIATLIFFSNISVSIFSQAHLAQEFRQGVLHGFAATSTKQQQSREQASQQHKNQEEKLQKPKAKRVSSNSKSKNSLLSMYVAPKNLKGISDVTVGSAGGGEEEEEGERGEEEVDSDGFLRRPREEQEELGRRRRRCRRCGGEREQRVIVLGHREQGQVQEDQEQCRELNLII